MLKLVRRPGGNWIVRGTHPSGRRAHKGAGTRDRKAAEAYRRKLEQEPRDRYRLGREATATFAEAVNLYLGSGGESRFLEPLVRHFGKRMLASIDQRAINDCVMRQCSHMKSSTIVRQVQVPVTAVMNAGAAGFRPHMSAART